ncbi:poly polymerase [Trichonephila clavipes]|nr:poly polymerase [Trichonephila clavipes]
MIPAYTKKRCATFPFETGIHFRRKTDFFPEEDTTKSYSGFEPEPTRLQAEGHSHHTGWATDGESTFVYGLRVYIRVEARGLLLCRGPGTKEVPAYGGDEAFISPSFCHFPAALIPLTEVVTKILYRPGMANQWHATQYFGHATDQNGSK